MTAKQTISVAGIGITALGALFYSTKAVIVRYAFQHTPIDAVSLLAVRMLFSLPFYILMAFLAFNKEPAHRLTTRQWLSVIFLGVVGYYLSSLFDFIGLQYISAGIERLILFLYPSFVLLINHFWWKQVASRRQWLALGLTYGGVLLAYIGELSLEQTGPQFFLGSFWIFLCAFTFALYIAGSGRMIPQVGATRFTAYAMLFSTAGVFLHFLLKGDYSVLHSGSRFVNYGLLIAVVSTVIPSWLIAAGTKKIGANNVAIISTIGPVSTIFQAHFILGEPIYLLQLIGTGLIVAGVLLIGWKAGAKESVIN